jgi:hypothetical protein
LEEGDVVVCVASIAKEIDSISKVGPIEAPKAKTKRGKVLIAAPSRRELRKEIASFVLEERIPACHAKAAAKVGKKDIELPIGFPAPPVRGSSMCRKCQ